MLFLVHQFGLFKFRTGNISAPSTPTVSIRSRAHIFGLDVISRNLFNARPGSSKGDFFGGSINSHRRSKTSVSRSSTVTQTTMTADSLTKFSSRGSVTTIATSMDEESFFGGSGKSSSRSRSRTKKLLKRSKSPGGSGSESEKSPWPAEPKSEPSSRSNSRDRGLEYSDMETDDRSILQRTRDMDESDIDLSMRLELARKNSQIQHGRPVAPIVLEKPVEETIYEGMHSVVRNYMILITSIEEPPQPTRSRHHSSTDTSGHRSPISRPITPSLSQDSSRHSRSTSQHSAERRPLGPRSPSPLPPDSPLVLQSNKLPDIQTTLERTLVSGTQPSTPHGPHNTALPFGRSNRQPTIPVGATDLTPKPSISSAATPNIEPLSIKKKTSVRAPANGSPTPARKSFTRSSPFSRATARISPRRVSPQIRSLRATTGVSNSDAERTLNLVQTTKEDVCALQ